MQCTWRFLEHPDVAGNIYGFRCRQKITTKRPPVSRRQLSELLAKRTVPVFCLEDVTLCCNTLITIGFGSKRWDQLPSNCTVKMICSLYLLARNENILCYSLVISDECINFCLMQSMPAVPGKACLCCHLWSVSPNTTHC